MRNDLTIIGFIYSLFIMPVMIYEHLKVKK